MTGRWSRQQDMSSQRLVLDPGGKWVESSNSAAIPVQPVASAPKVPGPDLATAPVELRAVQRRQLYIDSKPVGEAFE